MKKFALHLGVLLSLYHPMSFGENNICLNLFTPPNPVFFQTLVDSKGLSLIVLDPPRKPDVTLAGGVLRKKILEGDTDLLP